MNDFSEIETELKKLRPAPVRAELRTRIEEELAQPAMETASSGVIRQGRSARANWLSLGLGLGVAAAAGLLMLARVRDSQQPTRQERVAAVTPSRGKPATGTDARLLPAGLTEVVYNTRDEGLQFLEGATQPVRRMRYQTHETLRWRNPETGASLRVSYPSEEVVLIPVAGQ